MSQNFKTKYSDRKEYVSRELLVKDKFMDHGIELEEHGIGACSEEIFWGYSKDHGGESGDADFVTPCGNLLVEVTGTSSPISPNSAFWVRPDKLRNASKKLLRQDKLTAIAHVIKNPKTGKDLTRFIMVSKEFIKRGRELEKKEMNVRGGKEFFYVIPVNHYSVFSEEEFFCLAKQFYGKDKNGQPNIWMN